MTDEELFEIIDTGIEAFKQNEGNQQGIKVHKRPHSDWLIFNWRQLTWTINELHYLLEVCPNFDEKENIASWTFYTAVSHDSDNKRFYLSKTFADKVNLEFIAKNIAQLLVVAYNYIISISRKEIPFGVELR